MEFKGTQGKWKYYKAIDGFYTVATGKVNGLFVSSFHSNWSEREANALLISKAPEMLEMLKHVYAMQEEGDGNCKHLRKRVLKLVKQATEL